MNYLNETIKIKSIEQIPSDTEGILCLSDNQSVINYCMDHHIPVAAYEHDDITGLHCDHILLDVDDVDDEVFENIYRRCAGIPWDIATTERTLIREFGMSDLDKLFSLYDKPGITDFMEPLFPYEEEKAYEENYIKYIYKIYGYGMWLVFDRHTGELIGRAGFESRETCFEPNQAELGFCISPDRWRQGLAFEVCSKIIELARDEHELSSLIARCDADNTASQRLLQKLGFSFDRVLEDGDCRYVLKL